MWYCRCVVHVQSSHRGRLLCWLLPSATFCAAGIALHVAGTIPLNKNLYSPSYVLLTGALPAACAVPPLPHTRHVLAACLMFPVSLESLESLQDLDLPATL